jgi:hypothetical protein
MTLFPAIIHYYPSNSVISFLNFLVFPRYIKWPESMAEKIKVSEGFANAKRGRPCVLGCVDGTHISIISPAKGSEAAYVNRKGFYSLNTIVSIIACPRLER